MPWPESLYWTARECHPRRDLPSNQQQGQILGMSMLQRAAMAGEMTLSDHQGMSMRTLQRRQERKKHQYV